MFEHAAAGDQEAAIAAAAEAAAIGERFGDADLFALAAQDQGIMLIGRGRVAEGLRLLDEAMVAVTAGELSPIVNGFVYCGVITGCQAAYEPRRAREWTAALTRWCEQQPDMVSFTGTCLVHRAEILQLHGDWREALDEARRARERCEAAKNAPVAAQALYRQGELHRLRGDFDAAEAAYRDASRGGCEPQPGFALLRLAQGNVETAAAAIRRLEAETADPVRRAGLLPAAVEILLAAGDLAAAQAARDELVALAERGGMLGALADYSRGAVELAAGDPHAALVSLRRAAQAWLELDAPYDAGAHARARERGLPRRRRRRHGRAGTGRGTRDVRAARRGAGHRSPGPGRHAWPDGARVAGAAAGRDRAQQPRDRRPRSSSASTRSPATSRTCSPSSASRRAPRRARSRSRTASCVVRTDHLARSRGW